MCPRDLWQLTVVVSPVWREGFAVVMDAANAATLFLRAGIELRTSDAGVWTNSVVGRMTFYGSTRATVAVWRPQAVAGGDVRPCAGGPVGGRRGDDG